VEVAAMLRTIGYCAAAFVVFCVLPLRGEGLPAGGGATEAIAAQIAALVEQLDRPEFAERQAASQQLEEAGTAALYQLELTVTAGSREASGRALDILKQHFQRGSDEAKLAAREVLLRLAESKSASTAQRARDVLNPPKPPGVVTPVGIQPGMPAPRNNFGGGFNGNFGWGNNGNPGGFRQISISDINGRRVVEIDERERRVKMETAPGGAIEIEITDKQNARGQPRKLDAKDLDELKRKDGELGRLYEQYNRAGQGRLGGAVPAAAPPFGFGEGGLPRQPLAPAEATKRQLEIIDALLERYKERLQNDPAAQRMIDALEQSKQRFKTIAPAQEAARIVR
jgi:hypothetical protein